MQKNRFSLSKSLQIGGRNLSSWVSFRLICRGFLLFYAPVVIFAACSNTGSKDGAEKSTLAPLASTLTPSPIAEPSIEPEIGSTETLQSDPNSLALLDFDGTVAYDFLLDQMAFGPRWPGSPGNKATADYIIDRLDEFGWATEEQIFEYQGVEARNIIGRANQGAGPVIILGAHYDTRKIADQSPDLSQPVPGAVDGASGVAVLLELARILDLQQIDREMWLAFFDVEDNGSGAMPGFEWIAGSSYMAGNLTVTPEAMVLVDMVGDADQQLYYEGNSAPQLRALLWQIAAELGHDQVFIPVIRHSMIDDHLPFARLGIPSVDIIDFDYPFWHTVEDTADKASPESLNRVGQTLEMWLEQRLER